MKTKQTTPYGNAVLLHWLTLTRFCLFPCTFSTAEPSKDPKTANNGPSATCELLSLLLPKNCSYMLLLVTHNFNNTRALSKIGAHARYRYTPRFITSVLCYFFKNWAPFIVLIHLIQHHKLRCCTTWTAYSVYTYHYSLVECLNMYIIVYSPWLYHIFL